jgi:hypothetical protein
MKNIKQGTVNMEEEELEIASLIPFKDESCGLEYKRKVRRRDTDPDDDPDMIY